MIYVCRSSRVLVVVFGCGCPQIKKTQRPVNGIDPNSILVSGMIAAGLMHRSPSSGTRGPLNDGVASRNHVGVDEGNVGLWPTAYLTPM